MKKRTVLLVVAVLAALALSACTNLPPVFVPAPGEGTALPAEPALGDATALPAEPVAAAADPLVGTSWQWTGLVEAAPAAQSAVPNPESYTLAFEPEGMVSIKADCNMVTGAYVVDESALTITLGASTEAFCGDASMDQQYLTLLSQVASYTLEGDHLTLGLKDDLGEMQFTPAVAVAERAPAPANPLVGTSWQWAALVETAPAAQTVVPNPENYTLAFQPAGIVSIKADCNMVTGQYTIEGDALTIALGPSTMAFCGEESLDRRYLAALSLVATYVLDGDALALGLKEGVGEMQFVSPESAAEVVDPLAGTSWQWTGLVETAPAAQSAVPDPESYTLSFEPHGIVSVKADCNMVNGVYTVDGDALTITLGPSTLAFCGEASADQTYLAALAQVNSYALTDSALTLGLKDDAGEMQFTAVEGIEPGTAPAQEPVAEPLPVEGLTNALWLWQSLPAEGETTASEQPESYTLFFHNDGMYSVRADCNRGVGAYIADAGSLTLKPGPMTMAACGPLSKGSVFLKALGGVSTRALEGNTLTLTGDGDVALTFQAGGDMVTGNVTYLERIALVPGSAVRVKIADVSIADAPATVIGEQVIVTEDQQVPIPYAVSYDPSVILANHTYRVAARIEDPAGKLIFISDTEIPVITKGAPTTDVEVLVVPVE
jgi:heat shock protein HslJ